MSEKITVSATIQAESTKVWDYYNSPEQITKWNFADPSWQRLYAFNDMQVGGKYAARMEAKDGSFGFDFEATYTQVELGKSFTHTMQDGGEVSTVFVPKGDQTEVEVSFDAEDENPVEFQKQGWQAILTNFKQYAEMN